MFHLYIGPQTELLKRLAELQCQGEANTVGDGLHEYKMQQMILILSFDTMQAVKAML